MLKNNKNKRGGRDGQDVASQGSSSQKLLLSGDDPPSRQIL